MNFNNIIVIRLSSLGDLVRLVPTLKTLKENCQRIIFLTEDRFFEITRMYPFYDEVIFFPRKKLNLKNLLNFLKNLRKEEFDLTLDLHGIFKSAILAKLTKTKRNMGYPKKFSKEFAHIFYKEKIFCGKETSISRYERYNFALKHLNLKVKNQDEFYLPLIPKEARDFAEKFLKKNNLEDKNFAFLFVGASLKQKFKRWPLFRFKQLAFELKDKMKIEPLFAYGPDEIELESQLKDNFLTLPPLNLMKTASIILRSSLFVGADTGLMHLAAISGIKTVAVMGATNPLINKPYGTKSAIVYKEGIFLECGGENCPHKNCMGKITQKDVLEKIKELLENQDAL